VFKDTYETLYRLPDHAFTDKRCRDAERHDFSSLVKEFAKLFVVMRAKRERAEYEPFTALKLSAVEADLKQVKAALDGFRRSDAAERARFAYFVAFRSNRKQASG
jgi:hypothetical protein